MRGTNVSFLHSAEEGNMRQTRKFGALSRKAGWRTFEEQGT
jgi:hypothetical protein